VYTKGCKKPDLAAKQTKFAQKKILLDYSQELRLSLSSSLACKITFSPLVVTIVAIQPIMPKYKTRRVASMSGEKASPKNDKRLGTGRTLMSPCR